MEVISRAGNRQESSVDSRMFVRSALASLLAEPRVQRTELGSTEFRRGDLRRGVPVRWLLRQLTWREPCPAILYASRLPSLPAIPWEGNMRFADLAEAKERLVETSDEKR